MEKRLNYSLCLSQHWQPTALADNVVQVSIVKKCINFNMLTFLQYGGEITNIQFIFHIMVLFLIKVFRIYLY